MKDEMEEFKEIVKPVIKWLADNFHPHTSIQIDSTSAELVEGVRGFVTHEFIKD